MKSQHIGSVPLRLLAPQALHGFEGLNQAFLFSRRERREHGTGFVPRSGIERKEGGSSLLRQGEVIEAAIGVGRISHHQAAVLEVPEHPAQIPRVEAQVRAQLRRGWLFPLKQLVEHAPLGQRERAPQQSLAQGANLLGVEAVEPPHRSDS